MSNNQQITSGGIPQQSGLETFSSIINYTGEFLNWGDAFSYGSQLESDTDYASTGAIADTDALRNSPATVLNKWYRYHTNGSTFHNATAPISVGGKFIFNGRQVESLPSYTGMYQKLSLIPSKDYQVSIQSTINENAGTIYVKTYSPNGDDFTENSSSSIAFPISSSSNGLYVFEFNAVTANDIIVISLTTLGTAPVIEDVDVNISIVSISIKEKQEYLLPLYAQDIYGNAHKVLRLNAGNTISDD